MPGELKIFSGNANIKLSEEICDYLKVSPGKAEISRFSDGEIFVQINENIRGMDVFVIQPTSPPVNDNLMELLIMIDAFKRASARRITAVLPYYGYARQDRKVQPRVPITAKLVADLITAAGAQRILALDLHAGQIQGFFNIPVDHLFAAPVIINYFEQKKLDNLVVVSPDAGGVERARAIAKRLNVSLAIIDKRREGPNISAVMHIVGDVEGRNIVIIDDIIDTGGTLIQSAESLKQKGANRIFASGVHAVLSGQAIERLKNSCLEEVIVTNTIFLPEEKILPKINVLSVGGLIGEAIRRIHNETSLSSLFV